jgi:ATP-dependent exoDNAse (exonuclease V) alpha subunit
VDEKLGTLTVEVDGKGEARERTRSFSIDAYDEVTLGYAVTTHKAQGATVENSFVLTDEEMTHREMSYVQVSRARGETTIFTTEEEAGVELRTLVRKMEEERLKELALKKEILPQPVPSKQPTMEY